MIKAVIFDLDATLLDRDTSVRQFISRQYDRFHSLFSHLDKETYTTKFIELDCHGYVWKDRVYQQMVTAFQIDSLSWETLLQDYLQEFCNSCVPFPDLQAMLKDLQQQGLQLAMITNGKYPFQLDNIKALQIEDYFDPILISEREGMKKPDPAIFQRALSKLDIEPSEAIYVGDHPVNDVQAAQKAGMLSIWKQNQHWDQVEANYIIDDLSELPAIVQQINKRRR
ncbi:HAD family hydrolase [Gracilibacillus alcaliphilus]|uniref:HAD family hydrolase n=1 Tax=Gracilibacillus alcaliphilus TaxID=1401441 RepID=UPI0019594F98|nr:HAD family hydrolase [Gracilibacillus alcaliphilus]MBM7676445.1 putative hydrolase of the HAD superfamily [Gracilibacillus alcaliphilus]